ncbi:MAG TPA: VWA domain-containing protein, partial [Thermoanaerobaculia bacterium]|nr:VWA domain-containing protein [Thermoanaerobaculia bacterium]
VGGLAAPPGAELRLTFATVGDDGLPRLEQRRLPARPARAAEGHPSSSPSASGAPASPAVDLPPSSPGDPWTWRGTLHLPASADRVAVLVEEPRSGAWGGALAGVVDLASSAASAGWDAAAGVLPGPGAVHLLRPEGAMLAGRVRFETVVAPDVARVELRLDGRRAAVVAAAPFAAVLDLGRLPLPRRVEAIAFDAAGGELGRDETTVNGGSGRLRVRLVEPAGGRAIGLVTVAAEVEVPEGRRLDRVELYWRDRRVATLFQPPFRHRLMVPPEAPQGLLRAVARTLDGGEAEDAVLLNGAGPAERVDVALTELYVVAAGADGRPVRGLAREDFVVREDGRAQEIATFGDASELALTLGLALDSSASMFVKLPEVREAALAVLDDLVPGRDQAFLVDFDDRARLAAGPTRDLGRLRAAARALEPDGRTSLWEAVVFSLVQLQGAAGRRALLLYSDGADEDGDLGFDTALDFARRVGVPVYAIVANAEAARLGGLDLGILPSLGGRIERIAEATGGRAWVVRRGDDLAPYYAEIREELAAQYRLGYYPPAGEDGSWRRVEVEVRRPGVRARTVAGYRR